MNAAIDFDALAVDRSAEKRRLRDNSARQAGPRHRAFADVPPFDLPSLAAITA
jgi:hypothetical protein